MVLKVTPRVSSLDALTTARLCLFGLCDSVFAVQPTPAETLCQALLARRRPASLSGQSDLPFSTLQHEAAMQRLGPQLCRSAHRSRSAVLQRIRHSTTTANPRSWSNAGIFGAGVAVGAGAFWLLLANPPASPEGTIFKRNADPLSILDPDALANSTAHLRQMSTPDLLRSYIVYLMSSSPTLVDYSPGIIHALDSFRNSVPILGDAAWAIMRFVSICFRVRAGVELTV